VEGEEMMVVTVVQGARRWRVGGVWVWGGY
jgi:hypothetical protein